MASFVTHTGDKALNNNSGGACNAGFLSQSGLQNSYINVTADDTRAVNAQTWGIIFDAQTNKNYAESSSLCGAFQCGTGSVLDSGTFNRFSDGALRTGSLGFLAGGGQGFLTYAGGAGVFTALIPAANGTISYATAQDCGTTSTCSATNISTTAKIVKGTVGLTAGTATVTGFAPAFGRKATGENFVPSPEACFIQVAVQRADPASTSAFRFEALEPEYQYKRKLISSDYGCRCSNKSITAGYGQPNWKRNGAKPWYNR
jgi:hypothetical protein